MTKFSQPHTRNVTRVARIALMRGAHATGWYADARALCAQLARESDYPLHVAVGVVAALSPRLGWGPNVKLARRMLASGGTLEHGALSANLAKARAIVAGADPLDVMTAPKTSNFYRAILTMGADGVVIDRHAYDVAVNRRHTDAERPSMTAAQYERVAECYRRAAIILSAETGETLSPSMVQSLTWVEWRRRYYADGAFDGTE